MYLSTIEAPPVDGEILGPADTVHVLGLPHVFNQRRVAIEAPAGLTVADLIRRAAGRMPPGCVAYLNGRLIEREHYDSVRPEAGTYLTFRAMAGKGGGIRMVAMLGLAIAAAVVAPYLAGAMGFAAGSLGASIATGVIGAVISTVGALLMNSLFPVKPPKVSGDNGTSVNFIQTARNTANAWGPVPVVFGRHRVAPKYAALPYTEIIGDDQYLRLLFCFGYGPLDLEDIRIGTTPLSSFAGVETEIRYGYPADAAVTLYPAQVYQNTFDVHMRAPVVGDGPGNGDWYERTTEEDIDEISIDFTMPGGCFRTSSKGDVGPAIIQWGVEYRAVGAGSWTSLGAFTNSIQRIQPVRFAHRWAVSRGQYDVRVRRERYETSDPKFHNEIRWTALRGFRNDPPVSPEEPLCLLAMRIKASDQLNGVVETLNAIATARLPDWDAAASPPGWYEAQTRNPASAFLAVLQGPANKRPVPDSRINWTVLQAWHERCTAQGWTYDRILDADGGVFDRLREIATAGRAALAIRDGLWGVIYDDPDATVVAHFTPRNSWGFESQRNYREFPHAWRVQFQNEEKDWEPDERIVYDDGYDEDTATKFEGLEFPGVTNTEKIWKHGRFHLAQLRLRPEMYALYQDFEQLAVTRGDLVRVTHDVPMFGLGYGRVKAVSGLLVTLDDVVTMAADETYVMRFQGPAEGSLLFTLETVAGESTSVTLVDPGESPLVPPAVGDLWAFGRVDSESAEMIVYSVEPATQMSARITLVDAAPGIREADQGVIPAYDSQISLPFDLRGRLPPTGLQFAEVLTRAGPTVQSLATLSWQAPSVTGAMDYEVQHRATGEDWPGRGLVGGATSHSFINLPAGTYDFRVRALGPLGVASDWVALSGQQLSGLTVAPSTVTDFLIQIVGTSATLTWAAVPDLHLKYYEIRFVGALSGAEWKNGVVVATNITGTSFATGARAGTYLIKAVSIFEVPSADAAAVVSSISQIDGLNAVEALVEHTPSPPFPGTSDPGAVNVSYSGALTALVLTDVDADASEEEPITGTYPFSAGIDLGEVYTSRVSYAAVIQGLDIAEDILAVDDVLGIADILGGDIDEYAVSVEARWTSDDPAGSPVAWGEWTPIFNQDISARAYEFRAALSSYRRGVTPAITELSVSVDMPDRVAGAEDVAVGTGGLSVTFTPAFRALKGLGIAAQDMVTGDYYTLTSKTEAGFTIQFFDSTDTAIARTFDYVARGYGYRTV